VTPRRLFVFAPLAAFLLLAVVLGIGLLRGHARDLPPDRVRPLPAFALAPLKPGAPGLSKSDLKGQVALVNVFASWCQSCALEAPMLQAIADSKVAPVYGVAWLDAPEKSQAWLDRYGDPFARIGEDTTGRLGLDLGVTGAPETYVIDKAGRIRLRFVGPIDEAAWTGKLLPLVQKLQAEKG
jgi:cytochrome c biogenesis protein CcmG/thiol:disulfide interchange protein DsbE